MIQRQEDGNHPTRPIQLPILWKGLSPTQSLLDDPLTTRTLLSELPSESGSASLVEKSTPEEHTPSEPLLLLPFDRPFDD